MSSALQQFQMHFKRRLDELGQADLHQGIGALISEILDEFDYSISSPRIGQLDLELGYIANFNNTLAAMYGARAARIGVNGSSGNNIAILGFLLPAISEGRDLVLIERSSHKSAFGGLIASGMQAVILENSYDDQFNVPMPIAPDQLRDALDKYPDRVAAVCLTSPTYEGVIADLPELSQLCHASGARLIVDSAWGSSFGLFPDYPNSAIQHADIAVLSPHKSGLAPSQVSIALFQDDFLAREFDRVCQIGLTTTSPNQLLLAVAEYRYSLLNSPASVSAWAGGAQAASFISGELPNLIPEVSSLKQKLEGEFELSPLHVCLSSDEQMGVTEEWARRLRNEFNIDVEFVTDRAMTLLLGPEHAWRGQIIAQQLKRAFPSDLVQSRPVSASVERALSQQFSEPTDLRSAFLQPPSARIDCGLTTDFQLTYPPGRPFVVPGERLQTRFEFGEYRLRALAPNQISSIELEEYVELFSEVFSNAPYHQFAVDPTEPFLPISAARLASSDDGEKSAYMDIKTLNEIPMPPALIRWIDPDICAQELERRCQDDGALILVYAQSELVGVLHARATTLRRLFTSEEWKDPLLFSQLHGKHLSHEPLFAEKMAYHFGLKMSHRIVTVSCMALRPSARGSLKLLHRMFEALDQALPKDLAQLPMLAEIPDQGAARTINLAINERVIHGILNNGHSVVYSQSGDVPLSAFRSGYRSFLSRIRNQVKRDQSLWNASNSDHPDVEVKQTPQRGLGVFATREIAKGQVIAVFEGETYKSNYASRLPARIVDHAIQVSADEYVSNEGGLAELINHSCEPNAGIQGRTRVISARTIRAGEEIVWDYRCSEDSDWILDVCKCGSEICTGVVAGFSSLSDDRKRHYIQADMVSDWLRN